MAKKKAKATTVKTGDLVNVHYKGTFTENGEEFDNSYTRGEPIKVMVGEGQVIPGFDKALVGMKEGQIKTVHILPSEGYGEYKPEAIVSLPKETFPAEIQQNLQVGMVLPLVLKDNPGQPFPAKTTKINPETFEFDLNHPLAGKEVDFEIQLVGVENVQDIAATSEPTVTED